MKTLGLVAGIALGLLCTPLTVQAGPDERRLPLTAPKFVSSAKSGTNAFVLQSGAKICLDGETCTKSITGSTVATGTNTGDVTLGAVGAVPNANGASLSGQVLTLQPANGSNPGVVTTGTQTFAGAKTASDAWHFSAGLTITSGQTLGLNASGTTGLNDSSGDMQLLVATGKLAALFTNGSRTATLWDGGLGAGNGGLWLGNVTPTATNAALLVSSVGTVSLASTSDATTAAFVFDTATDHTGTTKVFDVKDATVSLLNLDSTGLLTAAGNVVGTNILTAAGSLGAVYSDSGGFVANGSDRTAELSGKKNDGATAIGVKLQNQVALTTEGARPVVMYSDLGSTEVWSVNQKGKVKYTTGASGCSGTSTLVAGTATVSTTCVKTGDVVVVSANTPGGTAGFLSAPVASITDGTSFVINSSSGSDTSTVNWWVFDN